MGWYNSSWLYRVKVTTLATKVDADLTDYPVYVNLADLPAGFHTNVNQTDARDIRVTTSNGTSEVPREVVFYTSASDTGELYFKATGTLSGSADTDFYIYYGNAAASDYAVSDTYGRNNVWTSGYVGVWHLQEAGDGTAGEYKDATGVNDGRGGNGTAGAVPAQVGGKIGNAIHLDGSDDYIAIPDSASLDISGSYTLAAWIYFDSGADSGGIISKGAVSLDINWGFQTGSTGTLLRVVDGTTDFNSTTGHGWGTGAWHFAVAVVDITADTITFYSDGAQLGTTVAFTNTPTPNNDIAEIGKEYSGGSNDFLNGYLDEIRVATGIRTSTWVSTEWNNQNSPSTFYNVGTQETSSVYTRDGITPLPADDTDLATAYSAQDILDVADKNDVRVSQTGMSEYMIHEFKEYVGANTMASIEWEGQTDLAPGTSTVYLQIYNRTGTVWYTVDFDDFSGINTDFTLAADIADLTNYKDANNIISCRVYQQAI